MITIKDQKNIPITIIVDKENILVQETESELSLEEINSLVFDSFGFDKNNIDIDFDIRKKRIESIELEFDKLAQRKRELEFELEMLKGEKDWVFYDFPF